jgi:hypothetical protein
MPPRPFLQALYEYASLKVHSVMTNAAVKIKTGHRHLSAQLSTRLRENN